MFSAGRELIDGFVNPNMLAIMTCIAVMIFVFIVAFVNRRLLAIDEARTISVVALILIIIFTINLMMPVRYDYVGTTKVNSKQIAKITDNDDSQKYTLKNGTSYVVYSTDTSHNYAQQKQTTYVFKRFQAKVPPIRRLFNDRAVPERVKLEITKTLK